MTPDNRGAPGVPKTKEHRQKISEGLRARREDFLIRLGEIRDQIATLPAELPSSGDPGTVRLISLLNSSVQLTAESIGLSEEELNASDTQQGVLLDELYRARRELSDRGGAIERMDWSDLLSLERNGLLAKGTANKEQLRRQETFSTRGSRGGPEQAKGNSVVGGWLPCSYEGCMTVVNAVDGSYCPEHVREGPREYLTADYRPVNLDLSLKAAEQRARQLRTEIEQTEKDIRKVRDRIEAYDKQHGR